MIAVQWFDFNHRILRRGMLLQVTTTNEERSKEHVAFVITTVVAGDSCHVQSQKVGKTKIVIPVRLSYLEVLGVDIPLFDNPVTS